MRRRSSLSTFDIISIIFVILSVGWLFFVIARLLAPARASDLTALAAPTEFVIPTETPSNTPTRTEVPTFTFTPTITPTPTDTATPTASITASPTITDTPGPSLTPSDTPTPSISPTFTPSWTPTGPTETFTPTTSPFLYDLRDGQVIFTANAFNTAGCAWQGIGGQVFDFNGNEVPSTSGLQVHVFGAGVDLRRAVGSNSIYGASGWEVPVDVKINPNTYFVELETSRGTVISPRITVIFPSDCAKNAALVRFIQTQPS